MDEPIKIDEYSEVWKTIKRWAAKEIEYARDANESMKLDILRTIEIRSRISTLKELLDLPNADKRKRTLTDEVLDYET
jgi:hypothetical protein